jgi:hypothetical protein
MSSLSRGNASIGVGRWASDTRGAVMVPLLHRCVLIGFGQPKPTANSNRSQALAEFRSLPARDNTDNDANFGLL